MLKQSQSNFRPELNGKHLRRETKAERIRKKNKSKSRISGSEIAHGAAPIWRVGVLEAR